MYVLYIGKALAFEISLLKEQFDYRNCYFWLLHGQLKRDGIFAGIFVCAHMLMLRRLAKFDLRGIVEKLGIASLSS